MSLFLEYEKLKEANQLLTPGSIWKDNIGEIKIVTLIEDRVYYRCMRHDRIDYCVKYQFIRHFHRIG